jgi:starch phosphorylase
MTESVTADPLLAVLTELALDLRWCWNHATDELWRRLDPELWQLTHNPWVVLQPFRDKRSKTRLLTHFSQEGRPNSQRKTRGGRWASMVSDHAPRNASLTSVAYFSMEFMLSEALPIYSGGLGNVAGDLLKAARDLRVPVVGVGLSYQQGYFRQYLDRNGFQQALLSFQRPQTIAHQTASRRNWRVVAHSAASAGSDALGTLMAS